jgi:protoheme IX farnesyltransferase
MQSATTTDILDLDSAPPVTAEQTVALPTASASSRPSLAADLLELTKPRMNFLVLVTTFVGYYLASEPGQFDTGRLVHALLGTALTAAAASVLNQLIERRYDARMPRTRNRPLAAGRIAPARALAFGIGLGIVGIVGLWLKVNALTATLGAVTLLSYVGIYTPLKRRSTLNTVVGAVPGAIPPVMGFAAASGRISPVAVAVFAILFLWQMPHFLAIAILYRRDYALGGFKMLPVVDEEGSFTARQMVLYALALVPASLMPVLLHAAGSAYFTAAMLLGLAFLSFAVSCATTRSRSDARKLFFASIIYLPLLLAALVMDKV